MNVVGWNKGVISWDFAMQAQTTQCGRPHGRLERLQWGGDARLRFPRIAEDRNGSRALKWPALGLLPTTIPMLNTGGRKPDCRRKATG